MLGWKNSAHIKNIIKFVAHIDKVTFTYHLSLVINNQNIFWCFEKKLIILHDMPTNFFKKQVKIVVAIMTLHNYI
ncbi:hypothetical protein IEQ34_011762 [Dendrobium chrysotoxum]|uniref:Uncharacterized protein n=1 Tax=Dendrobium chrysotoxum TaxID=161865 RepID=A0AAV7GT44_DENCH|nr:hypothetical protein IEQ34_011762 [Dendrobium chrysotoxum]